MSKSDTKKIFAVILPRHSSTKGCSETDSSTSSEGLTEGGLVPEGKSQPCHQLNSNSSEANLGIGGGRQAVTDRGGLPWLWTWLLRRRIRGRNPRGCPLQCA